MKHCNLGSRIWIGVLCAALLFAVLLIPARADTITNTELGVSVDVSFNNPSNTTGKVSGGTIEATANSVRYKQAEQTITITNNSGKPLLLRGTIAMSAPAASKINGWSYSIKNGGVTLAGDSWLTVSNVNYTNDIELANGTQLVIKIKSPAASNSATATLSYTPTIFVNEKYTVNYTNNAEFGSYTVNGAEMPESSTVSVLDGGVVLAVTPVDGYTCVGFVDTATGYLIDGMGADQKTTFVPTKDCTIAPVYIKTADAEALYSVNGVNYYTWESAAVDAALAQSAMALLKDYTLGAATDTYYGATYHGRYAVQDGNNWNYTVPTGATLLIPCDDANTVYTTMPGSGVDYLVAPSVYRTLTLAEGTNITVKGAISVGGHQAASGSGYNGAPNGPLGFIHMPANSNITVESGGKLYVWGYITGSGTVDILNGGTSYEGLQIADWRGGNLSLGMIDNSQKVFPMQMMYVQNVQVAMKVHYGGKSVCTPAVTVFSQLIQVNCTFIGNEREGLFRLHAADSYMIKDFDEETNRMVLHVGGKSEIANLVIPVSYVAEGFLTITKVIDTAAYNFPFNGSWTLVAEPTADITVNADLMIMPGGFVQIEEGAKVTLANGKVFQVVSAADWGKFCYKGVDYRFVGCQLADGSVADFTEYFNRDGQVVVNGTLDASAGKLGTTSTGANISGSSTGTVIIGSTEAAPLYGYSQVVDHDGWEAEKYAPIGTIAAVLKNADGSYVHTTVATYNYCDTHGEWYTGSCGTCNGHVHAFGEPVVNGATCTTNGSKVSTCECGNYTHEAILATGHVNLTTSITKNPTCTEAGTSQVACSCGYVLSTSEVPATGHTAGADATCTTNQTCTVCGTELNPALGHNMVTDAAVAPTCTATGLTEGKHCSVCNIVLNAQETVAAMGHSYDTGTVTTKPTLTGKGIKTYTCANDSSHTFTEDVEKLHKSLFFDFDNGVQAQERYNNFVYNFQSFDQETAWRGRTQGLKNGYHTVDTAEGTLKVSPAVTGFNSIYADSVNLDLNYDPDYAECFQMRFKIKGLSGTKAKAQVHFYYSTDNSYMAANAVSFDTMYLDGDQYLVVTGPIQEEIRALEEINRVILHISGFTAAEDLNAELTFDYAFVGPYEELPTKGSLLFDFTDTEADRTRYNSKTYGYVQFDSESTRNWAASSSVVSSITLDNTAGTATLKAKNVLADTTWPAVYMDTNIGPTGTKNPLHYYPGEAEYYQIRFKMKNFRIGEDLVENEDGTTTVQVVNPYVKLSFYGDGNTSSVSATGDYRAHTAYIDSDTWFVATIPLKDAFKNAGEINRLRIYFGGIESISADLPGEIVIDYIYIGKLADLPTPAYTVTFTDGNGSTLATQLVNRGESATYTGKTPIKAYDETFHYTFAGWDKELSNITGDTTITARFTAVVHHYTNGVCTCGKEGKNEPVQESKWKIGHTLNLASDISVNLVVSKSLLKGFDMDTVYMIVEVDTYEGSSKIGVKSVKILPVEQGNYYYFTLTGLTAVNMNDRIRSVLYGTKEGQEYYSATDDYSIADYAYSQMNKSGNTESLKILCAELLRYGAKAQIYKNYRIDDLADSKMTDIHKAYLSDLEAVSFGNTNVTLDDLPNASIKWVGKSLNLDSKVCLKFIFTMGTYTGNTEDLNLYVSYKDTKGAEKTVILETAELYNANLKYYAFTLDTLLAAELRSVVSVRVYDGNTPVSCTLQYSADTYGNNKTGTLLDVCRALFAYSDSAKAYFAG